MDSLNASSEALVSPTTIHDDRVHKRDSPKRTEKKSLPPTPKGKTKKAPATGANGKATTTPSKDISRAPTTESTESTNSADPASNSTPQPRAPLERKQSKGSCTSNDDFDPMDCSKNDSGEWHNQWWMCGFGETIRDVLKGSEPGKKPTSRSESPKATETSKAKRGEC